MMLIRLVRALRSRDDERGVALAAVIGLGAVLMIVLSLVVATATSGATKASNDDDYNKAMAAAYAGLSDYQGRLAADNAYVRYGVRTPFSGESTYSTDTANKAFGTTVGGTWAPVVGSTDQFYRYEVDNSAYANTGKVRLRVTGKADDATRTLVVDLRGDGFVNYLWFTNYESQDPGLTGETTTTTSGAPTTTRCTSAHRNDSNWNYYTSCDAVQFGAGDTLDGPVRTNDVITACGATFNQAVYDTGAADFFYTSKETKVDSSCRTSTKFYGGLIQTRGTLPMPSTNANMKQEARTDIPDKVAKPGCIYTGPTSITFLSGGKMRVVSPWTKKTQLSGAANGTITSGSTNDALCGSVSALTGAGAVIPTLPSNLVFVQTVPSASGDPNYWAPNTTPPPGGTVNGTVNAGSPVYCQQNVKDASGKTTSDYGNGLGYPKSNEFTGSLGDSGYYGCRNGDVFVSGSFGGQMTLAAENFVYVTGSIVYQNGRGSDDMLGLVGQRAVSVYNPISCSSGTSSTCSTSSGSSANLAPTRNIEIDAAIASNLGTFNVQNSAFGSNLGVLTIYGSIAQQFRGSVRTSYGSYLTGYAKAYAYDTRLKTSAPPKFLQPVSTTYGVTTETESATAFRADGTPTGK
ncbi:pilus assembly PilX family protein [Curtobacterium flaccumfaciens]|uniref:pilus assembly PilX family protein n=2 Tax=Curtobacterium flaccumfaciens TaxID=2035 RepID=UPI001BE04F22|nr:hypothetical protein [Curtobacterium flaccumfaciens]MBT1583016.1 hypothetical protein [Curtobacterium flaccumfaciens pv. flaccumfaciens]